MKRLGLFVGIDYLWYNTAMKDEGCAYCEEGELVAKFGIKRGLRSLRGLRS